MFISKGPNMGTEKIVDNVWSLYSRNLLTEIQAKNKSTNLLKRPQDSITRTFTCVSNVDVCGVNTAIIRAVRACECPRL